ncbi:MAG: AsmA family protein, partial [Terriglobales bacterium]
MILEEQPVPQVRRRSRRRWPWVLGTVAGLVVIAIALLAWYTQTESFRAWTQRKIVAALQDATGGKVELKQLTFSLRGLRFQAGGLVIHGNEAENEQPYVQVDQVVVNAKVLSWFGRQVAVRSVLIDNPRIHLIVYPDGRTNVPAPHPATSGSTSASQPVFDLRLDHAEVRNGTLLLNDRPIPFDFSADGLQAKADYVAKNKAAPGAYEGAALAENLRLVYGKFAPVEGSGSAHFTLAENRLNITELKASSGKSKVEAEGAVMNFAHPKADFTYTAEVDIPAIAAVMHVPQLRRGSMTLKGTTTYQDEKIAANGKATFNNVEYRDASIAVPGIDGGTDFNADASRFSAPHFFARALGGTFTGRADVRFEGPD